MVNVGIASRFAQRAMPDTAASIHYKKIKQCTFSLRYYGSTRRLDKIVADAVSVVARRAKMGSVFTWKLAIGY